MYFNPRPTPARIAQLLGYESTAPLDELRQGGRPITFAEAERLAEIFGLNQSWLLEGEGEPFGQRAKYSQPHDALRSLALDG